MFFLHSVSSVISVVNFLFLVSCILDLLHNLPFVPVCVPVPLPGKKIFPGQGGPIFFLKGRMVNSYKILYS
jgi:hypothetical protein